MRSITKDMTTGSPGKLILNFALPLMLGNIFQQLYTFIDTMIVGKCLGVNALAALGATGWLSFMMVGCVQGMTQGFSVKMSHNFGNQDYTGLRKSITHSAYLSLILSALISLVGVALCRPVLKLLNTPENIIGMSCDYLNILYYGMIISVIYNFLSAILRAIGNSKTPLKAITISSILNIILDLLFVYICGWGIKGAAFATLLSQLISVIYCISIILKIDKLRLHLDDFKLEKRCCIALFKLGYPMGLQNIVIGVGGVVVQSVINGFGILFIAGFTAANKLYALLEITASSYGYAMSSFTGQNVGAGNLHRVKKGFKHGCGLGIITAYVMSFIMITFGKTILSCFVTGDTSVINTTIEIGYTFLIILSIFFPLLYLLYIMSSCVQGMGNTLLPMISSFAQLAMRIACAIILTQFIGQNGVFWGEIFAWIGADIILYISYLYQIKKLTLQNNMQKINPVLS